MANNLFKNNFLDELFFKFYKNIMNGRNYFLSDSLSNRFLDLSIVNSKRFIRLLSALRTLI